MKRDNSSYGVRFAASMLTATVMFYETGSVSSASSRFAEYIGGQFSFAAGVLTVLPRAW